MLPSVLLAAGLLLGTVGYGATGTWQPLEELARALDGIQTLVAGLSERLELISDQQQKAQADLAKRLEAVEESLCGLGTTQLRSAAESGTKCSRYGPVQRCSCWDGYIHTSGSECRRNSRLAERCLGDADCKALVGNAVCIGGECSCPVDFRSHNDAECQRISCVRDQDCPSGHNLQCVSGHCSCPITTMGGYEYRLTNGTDCTEGNVELRKTGSAWGLVCDDSWDSDDASVICRSLGFSSGHGIKFSWYGRGSKFHMDDVECTGSEPHLMMCPFRGWDIENCNEKEVAGVRCS